MPRKRRKSGVRPLIFVESPVSIVHKLASPVYCSDHPATADVVPVEGNITWVSPQFISVPMSCRGGRRSRRIASNHQSKSHIHQNHSPHKHGALDKFKPLIFIGEPQKEISDYEDITMADDPDRIEDDPNQNVSGSARKELFYPDDVSGLPLEHTAGSPIRTHSGLPPEHTGSPFLTHSGLPPERTGSPFLTHSGLPPEQTGSPFLTQAGNISTPDLSTLQLNTLKTIRANNFTSIKRKLSDIDDTKQPHSKHKKQPCRLFSSSTDGFDSLPCRRSQRLHNTKPNLFPNSPLHTPLNQFKQQMNILVYDTPEDEYSMPVKQRRIHERKHHNRRR